jgi:uncharacterized membrane-anchored protein YhcB (DUF1043 family)
MTTYEIVRLVVWVIGVPIIIALLVSSVRRTRAVSEEIARVKREAEEQRVKNPYAQMAELYEARELLDEGRREVFGERRRGRAARGAKDDGGR